MYAKTTAGRRWPRTLPLLITALGDIIVWERKKYLYLLFYRYNNFDCLDTDGCDFFLDDIADFDFQKNDLKMHL